MVASAFRLGLAAVVLGGLASTVPVSLGAQGPRVQAMGNYRGIGAARLVDASFRLHQDGYVAVAHLGADGTIRIVYPEDPRDSGFRRAGTRYSVPRFAAGWESDYRWRREVDLQYTYSRTGRHESYDGGSGYLFVIASHQPMRFHAFSHEGLWDDVPVSESAYRMDPVQAIDAFAAQLTGTLRYTLHFVQAFSESPYQVTYRTSYSIGPRYCGGMSAFAAYWHSPYVVVGFGSTPWWFGSPHTVRPWFHDPLTGCVYLRGYGPVRAYSNPWVPRRPIVVVTNRPPRRFDPRRTESVAVLPPKRPAGAAPQGFEGRDVPQPDPQPGRAIERTHGQSVEADLPTRVRTLQVREAQAREREPDVRGTITRARTEPEVREVRPSIRQSDARESSTPRAREPRVRAVPPRRADAPQRMQPPPRPPTQEEPRSQRVIPEGEAKPQRPPPQAAPKQQRSTPQNVSGPQRPIPPDDVQSQRRASALEERRDRSRPAPRQEP